MEAAEARRDRDGGKTIDPGTASAFSPEGYRLYLTAEVGVVVVDTATLTLKAHLIADRAVRSLALTADGRRLYALSQGARRSGPSTR